MRALIISESEVSITVLCLLCLPRYTAVQIKNCLKSISVIKVATMKNMLRLKLKYPLPSSVSSLYSSTNQELFEKNLRNQVATMKNADNFSLRKGSHHMQPPNWHFSLSAKMNGTQRRTPVVSPWRIHCTYCSMPIGTSQAEVTLKSEKSSL